LGCKKQANKGFQTKIKVLKVGVVKYRHFKGLKVRWDACAEDMPLMLDRNKMYSRLYFVWG
jgi:hypothetical protein